MTTLLEQAKEIPIKSYKEDDITDEKVELAVAWLHNEVTNSQVKKVLNKITVGGQIYHCIARYLRFGVMNKKIKITKI